MVRPYTFLGIPNPTFCPSATGATRFRGKRPRVRSACGSLTSRAVLQTPPFFHSHSCIVLRPVTNNNRTEIHTFPECHRRPPPCLLGPSLDRRLTVLSNTVPVDAVCRVPSTGSPSGSLAPYSLSMWSRRTLTWPLISRTAASASPFAWRSPSGLVLGTTSAPRRLARTISNNANKALSSLDRHTSLF